MDFRNAVELLEYCEVKNKSLSEAMLEREMTLFHLSQEKVWERMKHAYAIMKRATHLPLEKDLKSMGGLLGGEAKRLYKRYEEGKTVCGSLMAKAISYAVGVLEVNSSMGLIVAAPTAGSSGVIPGVLLAIQEEYALEDEVMVQALFNAGAVGYLITLNATVSGAEGGCQAEVGAASAMAAAALCELMGGSPRECLDAASTALTNILGLVCDPIAGLVEAPCQKRNAMGASNALISAEMTLSGIRHLIPFDETVEAMYKVGKSMPSELRETAMGGVAATPTACQLCKGIF
ncbi:L-serine ammonia-lyase, iron-sulfur-dependent, subunit alpha [Sporanaerobium hydrogeniformans]|uniref:L-serine ammonia-lyase, iron-sulfur-dependent, subunit alpha n=1 Tax=Sporanaerobium hydrogeniformans TaxID=3072179 RepID=A0AC61DED5_9FIRM|nr:L-serine ammonia-lyase, iron-sulfur-dependent, subunit alpha [Sporanaerobium hydrogeniformans]PHV71669.1 L-serine ammonia-lyase, iron-sulfur-dependent, subunit alpha [Sporanaerobium hydrogeniformans]